MKSTLKHKLNIFALVICTIGLIFGIILFIAASLPCSGDGCLIHILYNVAVPLILLTYISLFFIFRKLKKVE